MIFAAAIISPSAARSLAGSAARSTTRSTGASCADALFSDATSGRGVRRGRRVGAGAACATETTAHG